MTPKFVIQQETIWLSVVSKICHSGGTYLAVCGEIARKWLKKLKQNHIFLLSMRLSCYHQQRRELVSKAD
jgi:hypothetical protein